MRHARVVILSALAALVTLVAPLWGQQVAQAAPTTLTPTQLSEITDQYLFEISQAKFRELREDKPYDGQLIWTTDTCSWGPDKPYNYDFRTACWRHDFGYRNYKEQERFTEASRKHIDDNFREDMYHECSKQRGPVGAHCRQVANGYYHFVRTCGSQKASDRPRGCPNRW